MRHINAAQIADRMLAAQHLKGEEGVVSVAHLIMKKREIAIGREQMAHVKTIIDFAMISNRKWEITIHRDKQKEVETIFFSFLDRKKIDGKWFLESKNPTKLNGYLYRYTFIREPDVEYVYKAKKEKKEITFDDMMTMLSNLTEEQKAGMMKKLTGG